MSPCARELARANEKSMTDTNACTGPTCENPKRLQIIEAAVAEFSERGFAEASMDRIRL